jgi:hypothetical protein
VVVQTPFDETEIYIQPFPGPGRNWQISTGGVSGFLNAEWGGNGREIFYIAPDN